MPWRAYHAHGVSHWPFVATRAERVPQLETGVGEQLAIAASMHAITSSRTVSVTTVIGRGQHVVAEQLDAGEPAVEAQAQVEHEVLDTDLLELR